MPEVAGRPAIPHEQRYRPDAPRRRRMSALHARRSSRRDGFRRARYGTPGSCQVGTADTEGRWDERKLRGRWKAGDLAPEAEGGASCGSVLVGGEVMSAELKVVVDPAVGGEEALGMAR